MIASAALFALLPLLVGASPVRRQSTTQTGHIVSQERAGFCLGPTTQDLQQYPQGAPIKVAGCLDSAYISLFTWPTNGQTGAISIRGAADGQTYCIDAGSNPANNVDLKLWQCYDGLYQQTWYNDNGVLRLANSPGNGLCIDVKDGQFPGQAQVYECFQGNSNQMFAPFQEGPFPTTTTSSVSSGPTTTSSTSSTAPTSTGNPPSPGGQKIYFDGDKTKCLTVGQGYAAIGSQVGLGACMDGEEYGNVQNWIINKGTTSVQLAGTNYCLDFGSSPNDNGVSAKIWTCYPGLTQQTFYYTDDNRIAIQGGTTCLDLTAGAAEQQQKPYGIFPVQSWQCTPGDTQQIWTL